MVIKKQILIIILASFILIFFSSIVFRVKHPSLVINTISEENKNNPMSMLTNLMQKVSKNPKDLDSLRKLSLIFMEMKSWDRAMVFLNKILEINSKDRMALSQLGFCYFQKKNYTKAVDYYKQVLSIEPDNYIINYNLGIIYRNFLNNPKEAKVHLERVLKSSEAEEKLKKEVKKLLEGISN